MTTFTLQKCYGRKRDRYLELVERFPLRPIDTEGELSQAIIVIDELVDRDDLTPPEEDYLDVLSTIVWEYEERTDNRIDDEVGDAAMINHLLDAHEQTQAQFAKAVGMATSTVSEILKGKRELTRKQLEKVSDYFKVSMDLFRTRK